MTPCPAGACVILLASTYGVFLVRGVVALRSPELSQIERQPGLS
jgi:hypothetical protein